MNQIKLKQKEILLQEYKTSHILHLLLSLFTGGLWIIVWVIVALVNSSKRDKVLREINKMANMYEIGITTV